MSGRIPIEAQHGGKGDWSQATAQYIVDLFSGIGGWEIALRERGLDAVGYEFSKHACATRRAAGLHTVEGDLTKAEVPEGGAAGIVGSPPCQAFSQATFGAGVEDPRGALVFEVLRWVGPNTRFVVLENVRGARLAFTAIADRLEALGFSTLVEVVDASHYGLPQARKRCLLMASRDVVPTLPATTAWSYGARTMAQALSWRQDLPDWCRHRASTTIVGSFRPEVIAAPGWRVKGDAPRQDTPDSPVCSIPERLILQGFPPDWPVQGPKTARGLQVGNAIPPTLARVALDAVRVAA
jgi:DNA (cytosine-5)-methyltransferase 1